MPNTESTDTKIAVVTGGSSGIGRHTAIRIAERGAGVILTYNSNPDGAEETVATIEERGGAAVALQLDVGDSADLRRLRAQRVAAELSDRWQRSSFDYLVNNAGFGQMSMFADTTEELYDRFHRVILKGPFFLTQTLLPLLADGGAIVNTTSNSALPTGVEAGYSAYATMKGGLAVLTRYLAKELSVRGIRVNAVAPGPTRTGIISDDVVERFPEVIASLVDRTALGRLGDGDDVGKVDRRPAVGRLRLDHRRAHRGLRRLQVVARPLSLLSASSEPPHSGSADRAEHADLTSPPPGRRARRAATSASVPTTAPRALTRFSPALRPELAGLLVLAALLNLWALSRNGWANEYYSAAVRSMTSSWHNFLYGAFDPAGVMTVDKPPLALWVQALSAKVFGFSSLSMLVPQALMGVAAVALVYDLTRRVFGRPAGFVAGLVLALTPITRRDLAPQQPGRAARAVLRRGAVVRRARAGRRAHALDRARGRRDRARVRDQDGRGADRRAGAGRGVAVGRAGRRLRPRAAAAGRWAGDGRRRRSRGRC